MGTHILRFGDWVARIGADGLLESLSNGTDEFVESAGSELIVEVGPDRMVLSQPVSCDVSDDSICAEYAMPEDVSLRLSVEHRLSGLEGGGVAVEVTVSIIPTGSTPPGSDVAVRFPARVSIGRDTTLFAPRKNGEGRRTEGGPPHGFYVWELAGKPRMFLGGYTDPLALPLVSESTPQSDWRLTTCTDPYFTAAFQLDPRSLQHPVQREINWVYSGAVPLRQAERRQIYFCVHAGDEREAIQAFYDSALAHVPPGPAWLHEIGLIHYDYFSKAGRGWFEDIDTLSRHIPRQERRHVCVCLHGWYDILGNYSMDPDRREIRDSWVLSRGHDISGHDGTNVTRDDIAGMLEYARARGFRVALYYGDGPVAGSEWAKATFPRAAVLRAQGWDEGTSHSVLLNPAHQTVREWFLDYTRALTRAFGDYIDALVWDETYFIQIGEIGPAVCPGYLDREFMTLTQDITRTVHEYRTDIAFLGSDNVGVTHTCDGTGRGAAAYSMVADGCWQDSACNPEAWPYGIFPNFRNIHWSCNWWPVGNFPATRYGADNFGTPAATSNGFGENRSLHEYPPDALEAILELLRAQVARMPLRRDWLPEGDHRLPGAVGTHQLTESGQLLT